MMSVIQHGPGPEVVGFDFTVYIGESTFYDSLATCTPDQSVKPGPTTDSDSDYDNSSVPSAPTQTRHVQCTHTALRDDATTSTVCTDDHARKKKSPPAQGQKTSWSLAL